MKHFPKPKILILNKVVDDIVIDAKLVEVDFESELDGDDQESQEEKLKFLALKKKLICFYYFPTKIRSECHDKVMFFV